MAEAGPEAAAKAYRRALLNNPRSLEALIGLGSALRLLGRQDEAETYCRRALAIRPYEPAALRCLGGMLMLQGRYDDALGLADAALAARPQSGVGWLTRGDALANANRRDEAAESYAWALADPETAFEAQIRLGKIYRVLGRIDDALAAFEAAVALDPLSAAPRYERGLLHLQHRQFAQGWDDYEARWRSEAFIPSRGLVPEGLIPALKTAPRITDLTGKRVLLIGEQGVGDQLMFSSMLPDLARVAASIVCICEPRLIRLLSASFPSIAFLHPNEARIDSAAIDVLLAMGSLGSAFRRAEGDFPGTPYLAPGDEARARWANRLGPPAKRLRIGLSWRGGVPQTGRLSRSLALAAMSPVLDLPDIEFVSLQYGDVAAEIEAVNQGRDNPIRSFAPAQLDDFEDQAALIANLDAMVSVQTAAVHLTGAIGTPCFALLPQVAEWRYMREGETLPWYASVRLFRQQTPQDWTPGLAAIADRLRTLPSRATTG